VWTRVVPTIALAAICSGTLISWHCLTYYSRKYARPERIPSAAPATIEHNIPIVSVSARCDRSSIVET
jgi:hypothetical protein